MGGLFRCLPALNKELIMQSASTILMIRPTGFRFNEETAVNNHFQLADIQVLKNKLKPMRN